MGVVMWLRRSGACLVACLVAYSAAKAADDDAQRAKDAVVVRALLRLPGVDLRTRPEAKAALLRHLETIRGSEQYLEIVEKFGLRETKDELMRLAIEQADDMLSVKAAGLLVKFNQREVFANAIADPDAAKAARFIGVLGLLADVKTNDLLLPLIATADLPIAVRSAAVTAVGRNAPGQKRLLELVEQGKLPMDLQFA